ncbi:MAG: recombination regulator RecX [Clostridiales bacterium]|nr:recombination regulator RecX [Clostridiales bacterium]
MSALYIDGEYVMNLDTQTLIENRFDVGREIDDDDLHEIIRLSNERRAKEKALWLISYRDHSKKELKDKVKRTSDEESAEKAVERLEELGLLNDESYARRYAEQLLFSKHMSPNGAVYALVQKGIDEELAQQTVDEIPVDIYDSIRTVIDRKYKNINDEKIKRRAVSALQRLGYRWDEIKTVLEEYKEEY